MTGTDACKNIMREVNSVLSGKEDTVRKVLTAILAGGKYSDRRYSGCGKDHDGKGIRSSNDT